MVERGAVFCPVMVVPEGPQWILCAHQSCVCGSHSQIGTSLSIVLPAL